MKSMTNSNAEPKPTPSTPTHSVQVTYEGKGASAKCTCGWEIRQENPVPASGFVQALSAEHLDKAQPASISSEPMPKPLVHEDLVAVWADMETRGYISMTAIELQQWRKWNAAKGTK